MSSDQRWVLASANRSKLTELQALLQNSGIQVIAQSSLDIVSPAETAATFIENALIKARHATELSGLPAIADDSGICVDALQGAPGVRSARFAANQADDQANIDKLLRSLAGVADPDRGATFHCVLVAITAPDDPTPLVAFGQWRGRITSEPLGESGFGYDPVFFDPELGTTAASLPPGVKNRTSHRGRAMRHLAATLDPGRSR